MEQTLSGYIRQHLADIEQRLIFGTRQETIVSELVELGYSPTIQSFRNTLSRARAWAKKNQEATPKQEVTQAKKTTMATPEKKQDPLTKSAGFDFKGTKAFKDDELI